MRTHVRAVDGGADALFAQIVEGKPLAIRPLPSPEDEPEDERTPRFRAALESARLHDEVAKADLAALTADELASAKAAAVERRLRDRVRASIGMAPWKAGALTSLAEHAARHGVDPAFDLRPTPPAPAKAFFSRSADDSEDEDGQDEANLAEVEAVCAAAVAPMRASPDRSLGIATMNQVQREHIVLEMDRLTALHAEVVAFRDRWAETLERFFIKNIETVQGDGRDVIFVSTVFGPASPGAKPLPRFGPINGAFGHRRLNVLFNRAKHHLRVFTSLDPDDIQSGPDSPRGAQVFKAYLAHAQTGRLEGGVGTGREADRDFEVFVRDRLRSAGYEALPQIGVAGYFIDLAVRDPRSPATFLLGFECDGASYHSSRSARDRDILRQQVLGGLGWTIYRIWSADWFQDPEGQTRKLVAFIRNRLTETMSPGR